MAKKLNIQEINNLCEKVCNDIEFIYKEYHSLNNVSKKYCYSEVNYNNMDYKQLITILTQSMLFNKQFIIPTSDCDKLRLYLLTELYTHLQNETSMSCKQDKLQIHLYIEDLSKNLYNTEFCLFYVILNRFKSLHSIKT